MDAAQTAAQDQPQDKKAAKSLKRAKQKLEEAKKAAVNLGDKIQAVRADDQRVERAGADLLLGVGQLEVGLMARVVVGAWAVGSCARSVCGACSTTTFYVRFG